MAIQIHNQKIPSAQVKWLLLILGIAFISGMFIPLMDNDAGHHALIAMRMIETGDYLSLYFRDQDYLDKPHFFFWVTALSFKIFGVNAFAYRLPSIVFSLLAIYSTFRLGKLIASKETGVLSAIILSSSYAFVLANQDVRMDAILMAAIIFSIWQLIVFTETRSTCSMMGSAIGMAIGFSTKGVIGIVMPLLSAAFYIIQNKKWMSFRSSRWFIIGLLTILFVAPVFYGFYLQFDQHPEKIIRGLSSQSGIKFLLIGQSLDRYKGTGWGKTGDDPFLFFHTFLWAFLPWSITSAVACFRMVYNPIKKKLNILKEEPCFFLLATIAVIFILISGSRFKLPHYLNILLPLLAIITGRFITSAESSWKKRIALFQWITISMMMLAVLIMNFYFFPPTDIIRYVIATLLVVLCILLIIRYRKNAVLVSLTAACFGYCLLNFNFFPQLLFNQAGNTMASIVKRSNIDPDKIYYLDGNPSANSFDFHIGRILHPTTIPIIKRQEKEIYIFTNQDGLEDFKSQGIQIDTVAGVAHTKVSQINSEILDREKRMNRKNKYFLLRVKSN